VTSARLTVSTVPKKGKHITHKLLLVSICMGCCIIWVVFGMLGLIIYNIEETTAVSTTPLKKNLCPFPSAWSGDGICQDFMNNKECFFDNGDCCLVIVDTRACHLCHCLHLQDEQCQYVKLIRDGICDDEANNEMCLYDKNDCCPNPNPELITDDVYRFRCDNCNCHHNNIGNVVLTIF
jgi:hypothetical protein